jgi:hypothetical protein
MQFVYLTVQFVVLTVCTTILNNQKFSILTTKYIFAIFIVRRERASILRCRYIACIVCWALSLSFIISLRIGASEGLFAYTVMDYHFPKQAGKVFDSLLAY